MDNTPTSNNQPNPTGNETPDNPNSSAEPTPSESQVSIEPQTTSTNDELHTTPTSSADGTSTPNHITKKPFPIGLIIGLVVGGVVLIGIIITVIVLLTSNSKVDYEATYDAIEPLESSMDDISYGDCDRLNNRIDDPYTSSSAYDGYITGCVNHLAAVASATNEFAKTSGAKHDETIKKALEKFQTTLKSIYTNQSDFQSQLSIYSTLHNFYLTIEDADTNDTKSLEQTIISATSILENAKNSRLTTFAQGFRERGLAYISAIEDYNNSSDYSSALYNAVIDKMDEFTDYIDDEAPEITDLIDFDYTKLNDLLDAYYDLYTTVRNSYYDHLN